MKHKAKILTTINDNLYSSEKELNHMQIGIVIIICLLLIVGALLISLISINSTQTTINHSNINSDYPIIIWNDDLEAIPTDGSNIKLEMTVNDTIYVGSID